MSAPRTVAAKAVTEDGYQRGLGRRQIQMMAIGGAIGTGLFLGAGTAISKAGPSILLAYALAGLVVFVIMRALGELLMHRTVSGSFAEHAREFLGPFFGFATGWTYWLYWVVVGITEVTAAAQYVQYWWDIPQWISALAFTVLLFCVNLISVRIFGELEFWFAMIKVTAIIGMILIGLGVLILGFSAAGHTASVGHLWQDGGVFPKGIGSTLMTLQIVIFAFLGLEMIGVTAGETAEPQRTLPKAINTVPWRIALFYIGALVIILSVVSWTVFQPGVSPFVAVFQQIGLPAGAAIVNFVVLTSALSSCNAGMYTTGRMLRDLASNAQGPAFLARVSAKGLPLRGTAVSAALMLVGVGINYEWPSQAFTYAVSFATVSGMWAWFMILCCHIRYRARVRRGELPQSSFKAPGGAVASWIALGCLCVVVVLMGVDKDARVSLYAAPVWALVLGAMYRVLKTRGARTPRRAQSAQDGAAAVEPAG